MQTALMPAEQWAELEFGEVDLSDKRRRRRLLVMGAQLADHPHGVLPESFEDWPTLKGAYRLLENPHTTYEAILEPHAQRVRRDCRAPGEYLFAEDTTALDFSSHPAAEQLGPIGNGYGRGLLVHSTLAMRIARWTPQQEPEVTVSGLAAQRCWARPQPKGTRGQRKARSRTQPRESDRWAAALADIGSPPEGARYTLVADREADIFETLQRCRGQGWDFIVRANQARALEDQEGSIFEAVARAPVVTTFALTLRARPQRVRRTREGRLKGVRKAHGRRTVELEVRACAVQVRPPQRAGATAGIQTLNVVEAREVSPAEGDDPIHWVLLTSWACDSAESVMRVVKAYACRWLIEEYHKALKTGTGVEDSQLETAQRIEALLAILAVVAVRLLNRKLLATTLPDEPADAGELGPDVLRILEASFGRPPEGWTNRHSLRCIARLGGFIGRKSDGEPGWITIWRGWNRLMFMLEGFDLARRERCG